MAPINTAANDASNNYGTMKLKGILASAYCVDSSARLLGFHYSTSGVGAKGPSGFPEALGNTPGLKSPTSSPPLAYQSLANEQSIKSRLRQNNNRSGRKKIHSKGAAYNIREECERLFCETMKVTFLGEEGGSTDNGSYEMGAGTILGRNALKKKINWRDSNNIDAYFEMWDYIGGCNFRGFVGGRGEKQSLFIFFEKSTIHKDLKQGLMALIEFAEVVFDVPRIVLCLDRSIPENDVKPLLKSLSWVGFKPVSLEFLTHSTTVISTKWFFLGME
ncbi:hypothetical protein EPUL_005715, partial [Erysiphe pulchra]